MLKKEVCICYSRASNLSDRLYLLFFLRGNIPLNLFDLYLVLFPLATIFDPLSEFHSAGKPVGWEVLNSTVNVTLFSLILFFFFFNSAFHLFILDLFNTNWYSKVVGWAQ